jgi:hypothetical protein
VKLLQVILGARLLAFSHVVLGEDLFEVILRSDGVLPQVEKPVVRRLIEHDRQVVAMTSSLLPVALTVIS